MTKHTPGPWSIQSFPGNEPQVVIVSESQMVANTLHKNDDANARLISAAPDLLSALIAAVDCGMVPISSAKEGGAVTHSIQVRVADQIRDAIAKATGETE